MRNDVILAESNANSTLFPPDNITRFLLAVRWDDKRETFGNSDGAGDIKRRPCFRYVANGAINRTSVEFNCSRFQDAFSWSDPFLIHSKFPDLIFR